MASLMFLQISFAVMIMMGYMMEPSVAFEYYVGGKEGWSLNPSKPFNHWASENRFQVDDSLVFKYENGKDSVLQVDLEHYITCNKTNPILALENEGDYSTFNLDHSGLFFFISGHDDNCKKGGKVIILVMAPRNYTQKSPAPAPSPFQQVVSPAPSIVQGISPVSSQAPSPFQGVPHHVLPPAPSPVQIINTPVLSPAPTPFQGISHVMPPAPSPIREVTHGLPPAHSPAQKITPILSPAPSPFRQVTHVLPPAPSPIQQVTHVLPPAPSPVKGLITHALPPAPSPSRVGKSSHHHTHSPAPSPIRGASHVQPPSTTPIPSPAPSPTQVRENPPVIPPAASPGPSDQAPSPDNGKSAAAPTSFGGDLLMAVLLFWMIFN